jgi:serine/threonine-protein kinase SRPK3
MSTCSEGSLLRVADFTPSNLEEILYELAVVEASEVPGLAAFLSRCLTLDPSLRPTARQLFKDKWLKDF